VVGERGLGRDVVLLNTEMGWGHGERVDGLAGRETLKLGDVHLDDEPTISRCLAENNVRDRVYGSL
jgi:hypothetical protein